ncbi:MULTISPECIES: hypothetical protein [unclassified Paenibacillus]|uniref:hypothetical protein n=1 Tax=unclassified Paenibacillus TaxID=185978 RepID=UPI00362B95F7
MKKKMLNYLFASVVVLLSLFGVSSAALAAPALDFVVTAVGYDNGVLKASGTFANTGDKNIETVNKVDVKIILFNAEGESKEVAHQYFSNLKVHIKPGETAEYTLEFTDVPEYVDATAWSAEEGDWEFTYFEDAAPEAAPAPEAAAAPAAEAALDFVVTSLGYDNGTLKAGGVFKNIGGKNIDTVNKVDVKISLFNDAGEGKQVADQYFSNLKVNLKPGEEIEYTLEFTGVPEYTDATKWSAEEGDWEFTYFE